MDLLPVEFTISDDLVSPSIPQNLDELTTYIEEKNIVQKYIKNGMGGVGFCERNAHRLRAMENMKGIKY